MCQKAFPVKIVRYTGSSFLNLGFLLFDKKSLNHIEREENISQYCNVFKISGSSLRCLVSFGGPTL